MAEEDIADLQAAPCKGAQALKRGGREGILREIQRKYKAEAEAEKDWAGQELPAVPPSPWRPASLVGAGLPTWLYSQERTSDLPT